MFYCVLMYFYYYYQITAVIDISWNAQLKNTTILNLTVYTIRQKRKSHILNMLNMNKMLAY